MMRCARPGSRNWLHGRVASADGDFPLGVTGKSLKRYLRDKYGDLVVYLGDRRSKNLATSAALA
jgi:hypothetical protein